MYMVYIAFEDCSSLCHTCRTTDHALQLIAMYQAMCDDVSVIDIWDNHRKAFIFSYKKG